MANPITKTPKQNPNPPALCPLVSPLTITVINNPSRNPPKLPIANNIPTAVPSPMGNTSSQPSSSIIGTSGIRKKELKAEMKLAIKRIYVSNNG